MLPIENGYIFPLKIAEGGGGGGGGDTPVPSGPSGVKIVDLGTITVEPTELLGSIIVEPSRLAPEKAQLLNDTMAETFKDGELQELVYFKLALSLKSKQIEEFEIENFLIINNGIILEQYEDGQKLLIPQGVAGSFDMTIMYNYTQDPKEKTIINHYLTTVRLEGEGKYVIGLELASFEQGVFASAEDQGGILAVNSVALMPKSLISMQGPITDVADSVKMTISLPADEAEMIPAQMITLNMLFTPEKYGMISDNPDTHLFFESSIPFPGSDEENPIGGERKVAIAASQASDNAYLLMGIVTTNTSSGGGGGGSGGDTPSSTISTNNWLIRDMTNYGQTGISFIRNDDWYDLSPVITELQPQEMTDLFDDVGHNVIFDCSKDSRYDVGSFKFYSAAGMFAPWIPVGNLEDLSKGTSDQLATQMCVIGYAVPNKDNGYINGSVNGSIPIIQTYFDGNEMKFGYWDHSTQGCKTIDPNETIKGFSGWFQLYIQTQTDGSKRFYAVVTPYDHRPV